MERKKVFRRISMCMVCLFLICPLFSESYAKTTYTVPNGISGYAYSSTYGAKLDNVLKGNVSLFSNTTAKYSIGQKLNNSTTYTVAGSLSGKQCYIFAQGVYYYFFGDLVYHGDGLSGYWKNSQKVLSNLGSASYNTFKNAGVGFGAYIRTTDQSNGAYNGNAGHSMIVLSYDTAGITILEGNADGNGLVRVTCLSWNEFNSELLSNKGRRISHVVQYKGTSSPVPALENKINLTSTFPSAGITKGTSFKFKGTVTSNYKVGSVTATITGNGVSQVFDSGSTNVSSYDLANLNKSLKTEKLAPGTYTLTIKMRNIGTSAVASTLLTKKWTFKVIPALDNKINLTSTFPSTGITEGKSFNFAGTVTSNYKVGSVTATIAGNGMSQVFDSGTMKVGTYDLSNLNQKLKTENLKPGTYTLTIKMRNVGTSTITSTLLTKKWTFKVIPKISSQKLSSTQYIYDGKAKKPDIIVKDSKGNTLVNGKDYSASYASGRTKVGRYKVTVNYKGNYSGTKTLYFNILPKAPSAMTTKLYGHDDVKISWSKSTGADGYYVYYKKSTSSSYTQLTRTTSTSAKIGGLTDGAYYYFKVVPYFKSGDTRYKSTKYKTSGIYTLKEMAKPTAAKSGTKVKISWKKINGATGYHVIQYQKKNGKYVKLSGYYTKDASKLFTAAKSKIRYYRVRAYKTVDGVKIFGPWSDMKSHTR